MPSPFPGMDPYLENVTHWKSVHGLLVSLLTVTLNESLPDAFVARMEQRSYIPTNRELFLPKASLPRSAREWLVPAARDIPPLSSRRTHPLVSEYATQETTEPFLTILSVANEKIVAIIEVLSPTNKDPESNGRKEYLRKQRQILCGDAHLVEIDLLRGGMHTTAIVREAVLAQTLYDYMVSLRRTTTGKSQFEIWAWTLRETIPTIAIPLLPGWADIPLNLQTVWENTYQGGRWDRTINYRYPLETPLTAEDTLWAKELIRVKGIQP